MNAWQYLVDRHHARSPGAYGPPMTGNEGGGRLAGLASRFPQMTGGGLQPAQVPQGPMMTGGPGQVGQAPQFQTGGPGQVARLPQAGTYAPAMTGGGMQQMGGFRGMTGGGLPPSTWGGLAQMGAQFEQPQAYWIPYARGALR